MERHAIIVEKVDDTIEVFAPKSSFQHQMHHHG